MKILIPTAKELNINCQETKFIKLSNKVSEIVDELAIKSPEQLEKIYKVKSNIALAECENWQKLKQNNAKNYPALLYFNGLMYRNIRRDDLTDEERSYIENNVFITSSLYGIIPAFYPISAHRLDFLTKVTVNNVTLKKYWTKSYDDFIGEEEQIVSLLSSEFEEVFSKKVRDKFIKIVFMEERDGHLKIHSTISKKARGKFLTKLIENQIDDICNLRNISFDNFKFEESLSEEKKLVFVAR